MTRCLVTGCLGFTGTHLLELLKSKRGLCLFGCDIKRKPAVKLPYAYFMVDLNKRKAVFEMLRRVKPDLIFHLAGGMFYDRYDQYHRYNVLGTINLLDGALELAHRRKGEPVIIDVGSSAEYGFTPRRDMPVTEKTPLNPVNYYGISKMVQGLVALRYFVRSGLKVIHARTFNLTGPGLSSRFVCGSIVGQIHAFAGKRESERLLKVGDTSGVRDFIDVRDAVRAYWILARKGKPGEIYNVCSGRGISISQVLRLAAHTTDRPFKVAVSAEPGRKNEIPVQIGDNAKLRSLGWEPRISVERSLKDMLKHFCEDA